VEYRVDKTGIIHAPVGKAAKGRYVKAIYMASTMGPSVAVSLGVLEK